MEWPRGDCASWEKLEKPCGAQVSTMAPWSPELSLATRWSLSFPAFLPAHVGFLKVQFAEQPEDGLLDKSFLLRITVVFGEKGFVHPFQIIHLQNFYFSSPL